MSADEVDTAEIRACLVDAGPMAPLATVGRINVFAAVTALCDALDAARARATRAEADLARSAQREERLRLMVSQRGSAIERVRIILDRAPVEYPCSCDAAYTERGLIAPDCAWHQDVAGLVDDLRPALDGPTP